MAFIYLRIGISLWGFGTWPRFLGWQGWGSLKDTLISVKVFLVCLGKCLQMATPMPCVLILSSLVLDSDGSRFRVRLLVVCCSVLNEVLTRLKVNETLGG